MVILLVVAAVVGTTAAFFGPWELAVLLAWIAACAVYLAIVWVEIYRADGPATGRSSTVEDDSRALRGFIMLGGSVTSLAGALLALRTASDIATRFPTPVCSRPGSGECSSPTPCCRISSAS